MSQQHSSKRIRNNLIVAVFFAATAPLIWFVFLRPMPVLLTSGTITSKTYRPPGTHWQFPAGSNRGFQSGNPIPIADCYGFEISVEGIKNPFRVALNTVTSEQFQVGQKVRLSYQERGIPFVWNRVYVLEMDSLHSTSSIP